MSAQTDPDKITEAEKREVNLIAHRFTDRMIKEKDIGRLLDEFFLPGFINRSLTNDYDDPEDPWMIFLRADFAKRLTPRDRRRYFIAENNFLFLQQLYISSRYFDDDEIPNRQSMPRNIVKLFDDFDPRLANVMFKGPYAVDDLENAWNTPAIFPKFLRFLEQAGTAYRRHAIRTRAGRTALWRKSVEGLTRDVGLFDPYALKCDGNCFGTPKGTKVYNVDIPILELYLIKYRGKMKLVGAHWFVD